MEAQQYHEQQAEQAYEEGQHAQDANYAHDMYLESLIMSREFYLLGLEICMELLRTEAFKNSGTNPVEYLEHLKSIYVSNRETPIDSSPMPF